MGAHSQIEFEQRSLAAWVRLGKISPGPLAMPVFEKSSADGDDAVVEMLLEEVMPALADAGYPGMPIRMERDEQMDSPIVRTDSSFACVTVRGPYEAARSYTEELVGSFEKNGYTIAVMFGYPTGVLTASSGAPTCT